MFGRGIITTMTFCIELVKLESISHKIVSEKKMVRVNHWKTWKENLKKNSQKHFFSRAWKLRMWNRVEFFCEILLGFFLFFFELDFRESQKCVKKEGAAVHVFLTGVHPYYFLSLLLIKDKLLTWALNKDKKSLTSKHFPFSKFLIEYRQIVVCQRFSKKYKF